VSSNTSAGPIYTESGSAGAAGEAVAGDGSAGEAETGVQGEAEPSKTMSGNVMSSLFTGNGCAVRGGVSKAVEHSAKKAWNTIGMLQSILFHFFKCLRNPIKPSIFVSFAFVVTASQGFSTRWSNTMACVLINMLLGSQWRAAGEGFLS
jgi:hypothetical protein